MGIGKMALDLQEVKTVCDQADLVEDLYDWLKMLCKEQLQGEELRSLLKQERPTIQEILKLTDEIAYYIYRDRRGVAKQFFIDGQLVEAFWNAYCFKKRPPANDEERKRLYLLEELSYYNHGFIVPQKLDQENLLDLEEGVSYDFVVALDREIHYSRTQDYDRLRDGEVKILAAPNHALLGQDRPVLTAGELTVFGKGEMRLWLVATSSGHYRPTYASGKEVVEQLLFFGVPEECIFVSALPMDRLGWKLMRKFYKELASWAILLENNPVDIK